MICLTLNNKSPLSSQIKINKGESSMIIKNHELEKFIIFLHELNLDSTPSRMRTRFKKLLMDKYELFNSEKVEIGKQYAKKDDQENPIMIESNGQQIFDIEDKVSATREMNVLLHEEVVIDETHERRQMLESIKETILTYPFKGLGDSADTYDRLCELFEGVNYS
jgi:hypothetical protein